LYFFMISPHKSSQKPRSPEAAGVNFSRSWNHLSERGYSRRTVFDFGLIGTKL